jgi:hypothetical protein
MTISKSHFRLLVLASFTVGIFGAFVTGATEASLPTQLQDYMLSTEAVRSGLSLFTLLLFLLALVQYAALLFFWSVAPLLMVITHLGFCAYLVASPVGVETGLATLLGEIGSLIDGALLAIVFLTPARDWFRR